MTLADLSIKRPILTWMVTLGLIVFGVLGYQRLAIDRLPDMEFPVLTVTAELEGASPEGMEEDVTDVIEEQLNTLAGVRSLRSTTFQGVAEIVVEFELGTDLDIAAQEVRDKVARVRRLLPSDLEPPVVADRDPNEHAILWIPFKSTRSAVETSEYVRRQMKPIFETIPGVAGVIVWGRQDRNIRIWLSGDGLRSRGLSAGDVLAALRREHLEVPGGLVESRRVEYTVKSDAEFRTLKQLERLVVSYQDGTPVYLKDVARVEDGTEDVRTVARYNGETAIALGIIKQSGGNTVAIVDEVFQRLRKVREILPEGIEIDDSVSFIDFSRSIREAVDETKFALAFGALLAVFTVFVFLRRTRPTLIIAAAIPISLVATFGLVWLCGYSLNTMTLLGMTLVVGVVIDDAIIVLENIERHRELGESPSQAASKGTRQIVFAATAATVSVAAVFLPVVFVEGVVGNFMGEFGLTVAGSVMISLFVALTLTPMLAARMPPPKPRPPGGLHHRLEVGFNALESGYKRLLFWTLEHRAITIAIAAAAFALGIFFGSMMRSEFFPPADEGIIFVRIETPPGTAIDSTLEYLKIDEAWLLRQPELGGLFSAVAITGPRGPGQANQGMMFGTLLPLDQRERSVHELILAARQELGEVPGRQIRVFNPAEMMRGGGGHDGELELEIRGNLPLRELDRLSDRLISALSNRGGFVDLNKSLKLGLPELRVIPDRDKAAALGVDARTFSTAVRMMIGGMDVGVFKEAGLRYDIRMRLEQEDRNDPASIGRLYVRANDGRSVELRNLIRLEIGAAPSEITRSNRQRSVAIAANLDGLTLGEAIEEAFLVANPILPEGVTLSLAGQAQAMQESVQQFTLALLLGLLVIYMVLAAQFESLFHSFTVMLAVPLAMVGSLGALWATGHTLNLFSVIGIILLFGLVTKNSILLIDFANQLREQGVDKREAIRTAAPIRMRPVLMTAIALIFAVMPAAIGVGPGAESRAPMAIATAAGMFSSTLLTLIVVPVFYLLVDDAAEWLKAGFRHLFGSKQPAGPVAPTAS
jgi:HAE1 family hydrophobic/amphiphilic exporter-1